MEILVGKYAGSTGRLRQFANDWMSVDVNTEGGTEPAIVRPTQVRLTPDEAEAMRTHTGVGSFWKEFSLNDDGTFASLRTRRRPTPGSN